MIINGENEGAIRALNDEDFAKIIEQKVPFGNKSFVQEALLKERERQILEQIAQPERVSLFKDMRSKNNSAKRRAKKKIADLSRRKNRK